MYGYQELVELLVTLSPELINKKNRDGYTPLHFAVEQGYLPIVRYLISKDAELNTKDREGNTLLHTACIHGHQGLLELLVTRSPEFINKKNRDGYTPLHFAVEQGYLSIVRYLISKDAKLNTKDGEGNTLLHTACIHGHQRLLELLVTRSPEFINEISIEIIDGYTPLHFAVEQGHLGIVEHLISKGAAAINVKSLTPLDIAILSGQKEIALFLSSKPDFNSCSQENRIKLNEFQRTANSPSLSGRSSITTLATSPSLAGRSSVTSNIISLLSPILSPDMLDVIEDDIGNLFGDNSSGQPLTAGKLDKKINEPIEGFTQEGNISMNPNEFQHQNIQQEIIIPNHVESSYSDTSSSSLVVSSTCGSLSDVNTSDITPMDTSDWNEVLADVAADDLLGPNSSLDELDEITQHSKRQRTS